MLRKINKIEAKLPALPKRKRVAAYARVSMESDRLIHSLSAQISYYSELIQNNPEWEYAGVYADSFITGTDTKKRSEFQRLVADCNAGLIDIVLCKSISRFARNTVDLLVTVRHLKELGIEVRFEKEGINSLSGDGELMLTVLASFAEQESISISENIKWSIQKRFEKGEPWAREYFGYTRVGSDFIINEEEAAIIRKIFDDFLNDVPMNQTAVWLENNGCRFTTKQFVKGVLTNEIYVGDIILQKFYSPKVRHCVKNNGEKAKYLVKDHHEPIISNEVFQKVQDKIKQSLDFNPEAHRIARVKCFSSKITCSCCGGHYVSYPVHSHGGSLKENWVCYTKLTSRKEKCQIGNITGEKLRKACCDILGTDEFDELKFTSMIHNILVYPDGRLDFSFYDGTTATSSIKFYNSADRKFQEPHTKIYGYTWTGTEYIINEEEAAAVRLVCDDYLNNVTISDISRKMIKLGYKSKRGSFSRRMVLYILSNVFYTGTRIFLGEVYENDHPAIISKEEYEKIRIRREKYAKNRENSGNDKPIHSGTA